MMRAGDTALSDINILTHYGEWRKVDRDGDGDRDGDRDLMMRTMRGGGLRIAMYVLFPLPTPAHWAWHGVHDTHTLIIHKTKMKIKQT